MTAKPEGIEETTRICIKNVPPSYTESKLKSHLASSSEPLTITDCKILRTKDGVSRKLAFVGFKDSKMANHAIKFFDKSFAATSRLSVEAAFSKNSHNTEHRPWSKHSKGSSRYDSLHKKEDGDSKDDEKKDPAEEKEEIDEILERKKKEFVDVIMGGKKSSSNLFWANDDGAGVAKKSTKAMAQKDDGTGVAKQSTSTVDKKKESDSDSDDSSGSDSDDDSVDVMKTYKSEISDMDFLKSKVLSNKENLSEEDDDGDDTKSGDDSSSAPSSVGSDDDESDSDNDSVDCGKNEGLTKEEKIISNDTTEISEEALLVTTARLFIRNLPFSAIEDDIKEVFSPFGNIVECHIPVDDTDRNKGYAFVKFALDEEASAAMESLDGTPFQGRLMHILPARKEKNVSGEIGEADTDITHKMKKELERQKDAGNSTGWNASFIRGDAVVDNLASRLGMDKGSILNVKDGLSSGNAAVRLALGETQVIEENKKYFEKHGVDIEGLVSTKSDKNGSGKRSGSMILVKNLPFDTSLEELSKVFIAVGGNKPQVLLPPSRTIALVIYSNNNDAKRAFRKLAYKRFKHVPLYLEWASLTKPMTKVELDKSSASVTGNVTVQENDDEPDQDALEEGNSTSVYVKNLNFRTTEEELKQVFEQEVGNVRSVRIPSKTAALKTSHGMKSSETPVRQSMGFGFVEFSSQEAAKKALSSLQGKVIDGHDIELKISKANENMSSKAVGKKAKPGTKIMVRNVPFQASRTEILQLFGSFGQLKTVRLPKKYDGGHRGFAFVEFTGAKEALNAMKALASTHLYGRHLVIEWAEEKEKRDSTSAGLTQTAAQPQNKKIRFD